MRDPTRTSLTASALVRVGLRVAAVILAMTAFSYYHVVTALEARSIESLEKYVAERGRRERVLFEIAEARQTAVRAAALERLRAAADTDPREEFDARFARLGDGTTRTRLEGFDGTRHSFGFIGRSVELDADLRRRVMVFLGLSDQFGPAWRGVFQNFYITAPDNLLIGYWPEVPDWAHRADAALDISKEEYSWAADPAHDPDRETVWTGLFYDKVSEAWMVSAETPIDLDGRWVGTIGLDLLLQELIERTVGDHLEGAHNFIVRDDGRLIAHPDRMAELRAGEGLYHVEDDAPLARALELVRGIEGRQVVLDEERHRYLAAARLTGPDWIFVTVYPASLVSDAARRAARGVLVLGLVSLLLELFIFYWVLRRFVGTPLRSLAAATERIATGDLQVRLDVKRPDELGRLAQSFNVMADAVARRTVELEREVSEREEAQQEAERALEDRELLLREIHHRVKNNLQVISSLLGMQAARAGGPGMAEGLEASRERVLAMARLHEKLYQSENLGGVEFGDYVRGTAEHLLIVAGRTGEIDLVVGGGDLHLSLEQALPCALLINELLSNCIEHAFPAGARGRVEVRLVQNGGNAVITIRDDAGTLPANWDSQNDTLGLRLVKALTQQLGGTLDVDVKPGCTEFVLTFPVRR